VADNNIVIQKIEYLYPPQWWQNHTGVIETTGSIEAIGGYSDITTGFTPSGGIATGYYTPVIGWKADSTFPSDPLDFGLDLTRIFSDPIETTIMPSKIRLTIDVVGPLDITAGADPNITVQNIDAFNSLLFTPVGGGLSQTEMYFTLSMTGTGVDIQTYVFEYDVGLNGAVAEPTPDLSRFLFFAL